MASADRVTITLRGVGGHGAMPHFARDPMSAAGSIMVALQTIVAREVDAACGRDHGRQRAAGETFNIIPETVTMKLSVRALNADVRALLARRIEALAKGQAESFGVTAEVDYDYGYPVLVNHAEPTAFGRHRAPDARRRTRRNRRRAADGQRGFRVHARSAPRLLRVHRQRDRQQGRLHGAQPGYDFNDDILAIGASYWFASPKPGSRLTALHPIVSRPAGATWKRPPFRSPARRSMHAAAKKRRLIAAAAVGNALEFYDFTVYSFFAILIGKLFFPVHSPFGQLMLAVASFGVASSRARSAAVIGMYADRAGRKRR